MAEAAMMTFTPIDNNIQQHFGPFHIDAHGHTRHVESHHFCSHRSKDFHQCPIYDSNTPDARLISIEYIVSGQILSRSPKKRRSISTHTSTRWKAEFFASGRRMLFQVLEWHKVSMLQSP
ncbi:hypothetical protein DFJ58DRAFT_10999 [Suillus subalutaceus]|uniref:uncharacterized protein n=1 Tax=Suillus subalutaceus TaxID=48586 RepID=UPI001B866631|nr:uncharacterized protein DFJ58DRAFT_10999 [Suillus subalutaceus]KAG1877912.1 hypothetical protein DFJ58DRAFT_10999 [Suillus subalutaceus]